MTIKHLGAVEVLGAEAIGQPGERHFRLFARAHGKAVLLWLEKEQLLNLALVIDRVLAQASGGRILRVMAGAGAPIERGPGLPANFPLPPDYDMQVGQLRLQFDSAQNLFTLAAVPFEVAEEEPGILQPHLQDENALAFDFGVSQARQLSSQVSLLEKGGRPVCPLCQAPLEGGPHVCARQNGYH